MMLFVPPLGGRSNFVFSPKSRRRALGSSLCNSNSQSIVMLVEESLECISVTSKPMQLNGHLHMLSVLECSTQTAILNGRCFGRSFIIFVVCGFSLNL